MSTRRPTETAFDSVATQPLTPEWIRLIIVPEFAPWSLSLYVSRSWLLMPEQDQFRKLAEVVMNRQRSGSCPKPDEPPPSAALYVDTTDLSLACPSANSVLTVFGHELPANTALARNLTVNALVRIEAATVNELTLTLVNGAVRIENLTKHPNIFDGLSDLNYVWPSILQPGDNEAEILGAIMLASIDVHVDIYRKVNSQWLRFKYRRSLPGGKRLWMMVDCPYHSGQLVDPVDLVKKKLDSIEKLLQSVKSQPIQLRNRSIKAATILAVTSYRNCTRLAKDVFLGDNVICTEDYVAPGTKIMIDPGRHLELAFVNGAGPNEAGFCLTLRENLQSNHAKCSIVRTSGEREVNVYYQVQMTLAFSNADGSSTLWQPKSFYESTYNSGGPRWTFDNEDPFADDVPSPDTERSNIFDYSPLEINWDKSGKLRLDKLPKLFLTGADGRIGDPDYLWLPAILTTAQIHPTCLLRFQLAEGESRLPISIGPSNFSRPLLQQWVDSKNAAWLIQSQPFDESDGIAAVRLQIFYSVNPLNNQECLESISLKLNDPQVLVRSPEAQIYTPPVPTPSEPGAALKRIPLPIGYAYPAVRQWTKSDFVAGSLHFRNMTPMSKARVEIEKDGSDQNLILKSLQGACRIYLPRDKATVDLISVAQPNMDALREDTDKSIGRDPSHGLIPYELNNFTIYTDKGINLLQGPTIVINCINGQQYPVPSSVPNAAWALLPWLEISPDSKVYAMHRNLVLERMECEVASRFLAKSVESLPIDLAVQRARDVVRARLSVASSDLLDNPHTAKNLDGWLPKTQLMNNAQDSIVPDLKLEDVELPSLVLSDKIASTSVLSIETLVNSNLKWMEVLPTWSDTTPSAPVVTLSEPSPDDASPSRNARDGFVPWLFPEVSVSQMADNEKLLVAGCAEGAYVWRRQQAASVLFLPHNKPVVQVTLPPIDADSSDRLVLTADVEGVVRGWDLNAQHGTLLWTSPCAWVGSDVKPGQTRMAINQDLQLIVGDENGQFRHVDATNGYVKEDFKITPEELVYVAWRLHGADNRILVVTSNETSAKSSVLEFDLAGNLKCSVPLQRPTHCATIGVLDDQHQYLWTTTAGKLYRKLLDGSSTPPSEETIDQPSPPLKVVQLASARGDRLSLSDTPYPAIWMTFLMDDQKSIKSFVAYHPPNGSDPNQVTIESVKLPDLETSDSIKTIAMQASDNGATGWAALSSGLLIKWDAAVGRTIQRSQVPSSSYLDNAGTVRQVRPDIAGNSRSYKANLAKEDGTGRYSVDNVLFDLTLAISTSNPPLPNNGDQVTDIRVRCSLLPTDENHVVLPADGAIPNVGYVFYSDVVGGKDAAVVVDKWPRLLGAPFRVVKLETVDLDSTPKKFIFHAVFPAPTDVIGPDESGSEPAFVAEALRRGNVTKIKIESDSFPVDSLTSIKVESNVCLWDVPPVALAAFPAKQFAARLKSLIGTIELDTANSRLVFRPKPLLVETLGIRQGVDQDLPILVASGTANEFRYSSESWSPDSEFQLKYNLKSLTLFESSTSLFAIIADDSGALAQVDLLAERTCRTIKRGPQNSLSRVVAMASRARPSRKDDTREIPWFAVADQNKSVWRLKDVSAESEEIVLSKIAQFKLTESISSVAISITDPVDVFVAVDNKICRIDKDDKALDYDVEHKVSVLITMSLMDEALVLAGCEDGYLIVINEKWPPAKIFAGFLSNEKITAIAMSDESLRLLVGYSSGEVRSYEIKLVQSYGQITKIIPTETPVQNNSSSSPAASLAFADIDGREGCIVSYNDHSVRTFWLTDLMTRFEYTKIKDWATVPLVIAPAGLPRVVSFSTSKEIRVYAGHFDWVLLADLDQPRAHHFIQVNAKLGNIDCGRSGPEVQAAVRANARLDLRLASPQTSPPVPLLPAFRENGTYTFVAAVTSDDWSEGESLYGFWPEPIVSTKTLGGFKLSERIHPLKIQLKGSSGTSLDLAGSAVSLQLQYSTVDFGTLATPQQPPTLSWDTARFCGGMLKGTTNSSEEVRLFLADQLMALQTNGNLQNLNISGVIRVQTQATPDHPVQTDFQAPVTLELDQSTIDVTRIDAKLVEAVYLPQPRGSIGTDAPPADLVMPFESSTSSHNYGDIAPSAVPQDPPPGFVSLKLGQTGNPGQTGFSLIRLGPNAMPYDPCLEPGSQSPFPLQPDWVPRLIHRVHQGALMNVRTASLSPYPAQSDIYEKPWKPEVDKNRGIETDWPVSTWNLRLIARDSSNSLAGILAHAMEVVAPDRIDDTSTADLVQSENVLVLHHGRKVDRESNAPQTAEEASRIQRLLVPLTALINISAQVTTNHANGVARPLLSPETIEQHLLKKGASGHAVHRIVRPGRKTAFKWIQSPFSDRALSRSKSDEQPRQANAASDVSSIDVRSLQPSTSELWEIGPLPGLSALKTYFVHNPRLTGWQRNFCMTWGDDWPDQEKQKPSLRITERPLWNLSYRSPDWLTPPKNPEICQFLPQFIECWATSDKGGTMIVQAATVLWHGESNNKMMIPTPPVVGCSRDPQHFFVPKGATIDFIDKPTCTLNKVAVRGFDLKVEWKETIATLDLTALNLSDALSISYDTASNQYSLNPNPESQLSASFLSRVNEQLYATTIESNDLPILADGLRPIDQWAPELYVVTKLNDLPSDREINSHTFKPIVELKIGNPLDPQNPDRREWSFGEFFKEVTQPPNNSFKLYELSDKIKQESFWYQSPDKRVTSISITLEDPAPPTKKLVVLSTNLRPSPDAALTAKISIVVTAHEPNNMIRVYERNCLFGDAASRKGVLEIVYVQNVAIAKFSRKDEDCVTFSPPPNISAPPISAQSTTSTLAWKVRLIKTFGNGAVLAASENL